MRHLIEVIEFVPSAALHIHLESRPSSPSFCHYALPLAANELDTVPALAVIRHTSGIVPSGGNCGVITNAASTRIIEINLACRTSVIGPRYELAIYSEPLAKRTPTSQMDSGYAAE